MPPRKSSPAKKKGKSGGRGKWKSSQPAQPSPQGDTEDDLADDPQLPQDNDDDASSVHTDADFHVGTEFQENYIIANFFETRSCHYDIGHESYKDEKKKARDLELLATKLGPDWTNHEVKSFQVYHIPIDVIFGDITEESRKANIDVIVNPICKDLNFANAGKCAKSILRAAGDELKRECDKERKPVQDIAVTRSYNLGCRYVFHAPANYPNYPSPEQWGKKVERCLDLCIQRGIRSISFPAVGTGKQRLNPKRVGKEMMMGIYRHANKFPSEDESECRAVHLVRVIINGENIWQPFIEGMEEINKNNGTDPNPPSSCIIL